MLRGKDIKVPSRTLRPGRGRQRLVNCHLRLHRQGPRDLGRRSRPRDRPAWEPRNKTPVPGQRPRTAAAAAPLSVLWTSSWYRRPSIDLQQEPDGHRTGGRGRRSRAAPRRNPRRKLAKFLKSGICRLSSEPISSSQGVGDELGQQALDQGLIAGIAGFVVVVLFLLLLPPRAGLDRGGWAGRRRLQFLRARSSLPPVVSHAARYCWSESLTLRVAAHANIGDLRTRQGGRIRRGRSIRPLAIAAGYKKGLMATIDANVVMIDLPPSPSKSWRLVMGGGRASAPTLGLGVHRFSVDGRALDEGDPRRDGQVAAASPSPAALGAEKPKGTRLRLDYMGYSKWFFSASGVILLVCALALGSKGINFGIDFESGTRINVAARSRTSTRTPCATSLARRGPRQRRDPEGHRPGRTPRARARSRSRRTTSSRRRSTKVTDALEAKYDLADTPDSTSIGPTFGRDGRQLGDHRDHRVAVRDLGLHRAAIRAQVRRSGAHRGHARHPHHCGRVRARRPGGDNGDGRGVAHHPWASRCTTRSSCSTVSARTCRACRGRPSRRSSTARCPRSSCARWRRASARACPCSRCCCSAARRCRRSRSRCSSARSPARTRRSSSPVRC